MDNNYAAMRNLIPKTPIMTFCSGLEEGTDQFLLGKCMSYNVYSNPIRIVLPFFVRFFPPFLLFYDVKAVLNVRNVL